MVWQGAVFGVGGAMPRAVSAPEHASGHIGYDTPPNPGVVVGAEAEVDEFDADAEGDDAENAEDGKCTSHTGRGAMVRQTRASQLGGKLNVNGKRPLVTSHMNGNAGGSKIFRIADGDG